MKYERPDTDQKNTLLFQKTKIQASEGTKIPCQVTCETETMKSYKTATGSLFFPVIVQVWFSLAETWKVNSLKYQTKGSTTREAVSPWDHPSAKEEIKEDKIFP